MRVICASEQRAVAAGNMQTQVKKFCIWASPATVRPQARLL